MQFDPSFALANDAVPVLVAGLAPPVSPSEEAIVARFDGLKTVAEIARESGASLSSVRALILQLAWLGAVEIDRLMEVDDIDIIDERRATRPSFTGTRGRTPVPEPIALTRRKKAPAMLRIADESPLVTAVLAALALAEASGE